MEKPDPNKYLKKQIDEGDHKKIAITKEEGKLGTKVSDYLLIDFIGEGSYGKVYKAKDIKTGKIYVLKKIKNTDSKGNFLPPQKQKKEYYIQSNFTHPGIVCYYEMISYLNSTYFVMEYCEQGDLRHYMKNNNIKHFSERKAVSYLKQIKDVFVYLHDNHISHNDLKFENILMKDGSIKITDFGITTNNRLFSQKHCGTLYTMAPEILKLKNNERAVDKNIMESTKSDLWSIGVIYYEMLFGEKPFNGYCHSSMYEDQVKKIKEKLKYPREVSDQSKDILNRIFVIDPKERMTWQAFFNHALFNINWEEETSPDFYCHSEKEISEKKSETIDSSSDLTYEDKLMVIKDGKYVTYDFKKDEEKEYQEKLKMFVDAVENTLEQKPDNLDTFVSLMRVLLQHPDAPKKLVDAFFEYTDNLTNLKKIAHYKNLNLYNKTILQCENVFNYGEETFDYIISSPEYEELAIKIKAKIEAMVN